jgi:hypothetical protein
VHYRRMEDQPGWVTRPKETYVFGHLTFVGLTSMSVLIIDAPADMPGATPWQDRDGTWYWRAEVKS